MNFFLSIAFLGTLLLLMNAILYFRKFNQGSYAYKIFSIYLLLVLIVQLATIYVAKVLHEPNLFLSHFYFGFQFVTLSLFYSYLLKSNFIRILMFAVLGFLGYQFIRDPQLFFIYNPVGSSIMQGLIVLYSLFYFYKCLSGKRDFIIVNIGIFLYLLSSALIWVTGNLVLDLDISESTSYLLINVNRVLIVVFQILIFVEWWKNYSRARVK